MPEAVALGDVESRGLALQQQHSVDDLHSKMNVEWSYPLPFFVQRVIGSNGSEICSTPEVCKDILTYLGPAFRGCKVYFSPTEYNPVEGFKSSKHGDSMVSAWDKLRHDLCRATIQHGGFRLISNGYRGAGTNSRNLICQRAKKYQANRNHAGPGRQSDATEINARRRNDSKRLEDLRIRRRTYTTRPLERQCLCHFNITIKVDPTGFFLQNTRHTGVPTHKNHKPFEPKNRARVPSFHSEA